MKKMSFEDALARLEEITGELSSGQATVSRSVELYKEAAALEKECERLLGEAKLAVQNADAGVDADE